MEQLQVLGSQSMRILQNQTQNTIEMFVLLVVGPDYLPIS
jgi:hypothetical protein